MTRTAPELASPSSNFRDTSTDNPDVKFGSYQAHIQATYIRQGGIGLRPWNPPFMKPRSFHQTTMTRNVFPSSVLVLEMNCLQFIMMIDTHNHSLNTAEALKFLPTSDCKEKFLEYFNDGMGVAEASKYCEGLLQLEDKFTEEHMSNSQINPP
ncbi:hypothetical protein AVEN_213348-1 [Araneus ventricosus]|uniref:Uncharacterized protein n=1 Tax=Araneus ventricosus TaxID=182803 RepID=A0A4Y2JB14_ARAVE|nr:hypothetical protein AVEN_213348-1 [Araneus ventricosus]